VSQEAPSTEIHTDLAPIVPSVSENPVVRELIQNHVLKAEDRIEEHNRYNSYRNMAFNKYGYIPTLPMDIRFLPPRSVPPDIGQRNPWSMSTQLSSDRQMVTPDIVHHPSPHPNPMVTLSPHLSAVENQHTHIPPPLAPPIYGGVLVYANFQAPGMGLANTAHQPPHILHNHHPFPLPYYYPMPLMQIQPPNPVHTLPTLMHIPPLSSRLDFAPWDSRV